MSRAWAVAILTTNRQFGKGRAVESPITSGHRVRPPAVAEDAPCRDRTVEAQIGKLISGLQPSDHGRSIFSTAGGRTRWPEVMGDSTARPFPNCRLVVRIATARRGSSGFHEQQRERFIGEREIYSPIVNPARFLRTSQITFAWAAIRLEMRGFSNWEKLWGFPPGTRSTTLCRS